VNISRRMRSDFTRRLLVLGGCALAFGGAACSSGNGATTPTPTGSTNQSGSATQATASGPSIPSVSISARDFTYDAPESLPSGLIRIRMQNAGQEDHQAQLFKLNAGVTTDQFQAALQRNPGAALALATAQGGPNAQKPGQAADSVQNLQPGQYMFLCFVPSADGTPHYAKGMIKPVQVAATSPAPETQFPTTANTVTAHDFTFDGTPASLPAGQATITFKNAGSQSHEMSLVKLNPGVTLDQLKTALSSSAPPSGPPPFTSEGGMGGIAPGATGQTTVNLSAGSYALICNIPDPATGKPHVALGMLSGFTVPG
jgi:uncharacterized cupredoxin-like copper-binding protein